jgi:hypothetical protein
MKGMDATVLRVCEAFNLNTAALPVYNCDTQLQDYRDEEEAVPAASDATELFGTTKKVEQPPKPGRKKKQRTEGYKVGDVDWIGPRFKAMHEDYCGDYEEDWLRRFSDTDTFSPYVGIHWLNGPKYWETNMATLAVLRPTPKRHLIAVWKRGEYRALLLCRRYFHPNSGVE